MRKKQLLDIPNELLLQIIEMVSPCEGLEQFTICCTQLLRLGTPALQKHRRMKKFHSKQSLVVCAQTHPAVFLHPIVADNTIAPYVTNLALGHLGFCWKAQLDYNRFADDCVGSLVSVLNEYRFITTSDKANLHQTLLSGCTETVYALLMLMLPNLTCIAFPDAQGVSSPIIRLVTEISRAARSDANTTHPLSRLSNLSLSCHARDADSGFYDIFMAFARLPSMRSLFGEGIDARRCSWDSNSDEASSTSIQSLTFKRSCIDTENLNCLFSTSEDLKEFTYSRTKEFGCGIGKHSQWSPGDVVQSLLQYARHTLVSLDLTHHGLGCFASIFNDYTCNRLYGFRVLKNIRMDLTMFFSNHSRSINAQERGSETKACLVFRLVDTLPESVEIMTFNTGCYDAIASRLLEGLPKSEHRTLSALKKVAFEASDLHLGDSIDQDIIKNCQEAGVRLLWGEKDLWVDI